VFPYLKSGLLRPYMAEWYPGKSGIQLLNDNPPPLELITEIYVRGGKENAK